MILDWSTGQFRNWPVDIQYELFFSDHKGAVNETFGQIEFAAVFQVSGECFQDALERPILHPPLEPAVARLVRWVPIQQIRPSARLGNAPMSGSNTFHCSSVRSMECSILLGQFTAMYANESNESCQ